MSMSDIDVLLAEQSERAQRLRESWGPAPSSGRPRMPRSGRRAARSSARRSAPGTRRPQTWVDAS